jgi:AcrR family transcriptional regulator
MSARRASEPRPGDRREQLLAAAARTFLRYGYRKTSMDDVAAAAGISRQALYLRFDSKEELFRAAVEHVLDSSLADARSALAEAGPLLDRLLAAFSALHAAHFSEPGSAAHMTELIEASVAVIGPDVHLRQAPFLEDLTRLLSAEGLARGKEARDIVATLQDASHGIKHRVATRADYEREMARVLGVVCRLPRRSAAR